VYYVYIFYYYYFYLLTSLSVRFDAFIGEGYPRYLIRFSWYILLHVCRFSLHDRNLLITSNKSGKLRELLPSARTKSSF
jgi:hypothetical protein